MRIGVDLDGVCYDFVASLRYWLCGWSGRNAADLPDAEVWDFHKHQWGMTSREFVWQCERGVDAGVIFRSGDPLPDTKWALDSLKGMGHAIHIVTNRSFGTKSVQNTADWLAEHELPYHTLTFAADKTCVPVDVFIEDNVDNAEALAAAGVTVFLMDRPWNRASDLPRVHSLPDFVREVELLADRRSAPPEVVAPTLRGELLDEAAALVTGDRNNSYGPPHQDFQRTADMLTAMWSDKLRDGIRFEAHEVAQAIICVKLSRQQWTPGKRDSWTDVAGYAACGYEAYVLTHPELDDRP